MSASTPSSRSAVFTTSRPARSTYAPGLPLETSMALQPGRLTDLASVKLEQLAAPAPTSGAGLNGAGRDAAGVAGDRSRVLAAVAAHRRADADTYVPGHCHYALTERALTERALTEWNAAAIAEVAAADAAEERGLTWAMAGLVLGGVVASGLGHSAALGAVVGLMAGAAIGWTLPVVPTAWAFAVLRSHR